MINKEEKVMNDLLSIIIPIYNQENNLERCLDSIVNQSYKNLEVIMIDDGSNDNSLSICKKYKEKYGWILIHVSNSGVSNARNRGLDSVTGKYVLFIDSDDYVSENYVESLYDIVKNGDCDIAYSKYVEVRGSVIVEINESAISKSIIDVSREFDYGSSYMLRHAACSIISRELIGNIRFRKDIYVGEDALFISQLIVKSNYKIGYTVNSIYYYVIYESSGNHGPINDRKMTVVDAWNCIIQNYNDTIPKLVPGCYKSLISEIESLFERMIGAGEIDELYSKKCLKALKMNRFGILKSARRVKTLVRYLWMLYLPKSYFRFIVGMKK